MSLRMQNDVHYLSSLFFLNFSFGSLWNLLRFPFSCWVIVNIWRLWIIVFGHYLLFLLQYIYVGLGLIRVYKVFFSCFRFDRSRCFGCLSCVGFNRKKTKVDNTFGAHQFCFYENVEWTQLNWITITINILLF